MTSKVAPSAPVRRPGDIGNTALLRLPFAVSEVDGVSIARDNPGGGVALRDFDRALSAAAIGDQDVERAALAERCDCCLRHAIAQMGLDAGRNGRKAEPDPSWPRIRPLIGAAGYFARKARSSAGSCNCCRKSCRSTGSVRRRAFRAIRQMAARQRYIGRQWPQARAARAHVPPARLRRPHSAIRGRDSISSSDCGHTYPFRKHCRASAQARGRISTSVPPLHRGPLRGTRIAARSELAPVRNRQSVRLRARPDSSLSLGDYGQTARRQHFSHRNWTWPLLVHARNGGGKERPLFSIGGGDGRERLSARPALIQGACDQVAHAFVGGTAASSAGRHDEQCAQFGRRGFCRSRAGWSARPDRQGRDQVGRTTGCR